MPLSRPPSPPTYRFPKPSPATARMLCDFAMRAAIGLMLGPIAAYLAMAFWQGIGVLFCDTLEAANAAISRSPLFGVVTGAVLASGVAAVLAPVAKGRSRDWPLVKCFASSGQGLAIALVLGSISGLAISKWVIEPLGHADLVQFVVLLVGSIWTGMISGYIAGKHLRDTVPFPLPERETPPGRRRVEEEADPFAHLLDQPERQLQNSGEESDRRVGDGGGPVHRDHRIAHGAGDAQFEQFVREVVGDL